MSKIIIFVIGFVIGSALCGAGLFYFSIRSSSKQLDEYRTTASKLESQLIAEREANIRIATVNSELQEKLRRSNTDSSRAADLVGEISKGLSGDISDLDGIIEAVRSLRIAIENFSKN